ncbi:hypothetical protein AGOR_G00030210 [Albula goreensis]|uniref:Protein MIS12 homolog n=1 Tax=Albula goreensis TaxID=1534307 RepID=A0A8T3E9V5_9TELE|nr:hypothetical protein AGOR_G00030210 [Albula goreensis]
MRIRINAREKQKMAQCTNEVDPQSLEALKLYEAQFFGFTPQTCMLRVYSAFQESLYDILVTVEAVFVKKFASILAYGVLLVNNVLSVPQNVLLPDDQPHKKYPQGVKQLLKLENELAELQQSYQAEVCARQALMAELEEQREVQEQLDGLLKWIAELRHTWMQGGMGTVQDSFTLMTQTVKNLQEIMKDITRKSKGLEEL